MMYNAHGLTPFYEWVRFALLRGRPFMSPREVVFVYNESPGTKVFTRKEVAELFAQFASLTLRTVVDSGDTADFDLSPRYRADPLIRLGHGVLSRLQVCRPVIPARLGTTMLIEARKT
jgi:hypothetical protein